MKILKKIIESHYKPLLRKEKESEYEYTYFIDCFDLIFILKGIKRFTEDFEPTTKASDLNTLAYNLILDNWIENVHLLPPHQSEFFDLLGYDFGLRVPHISNKDIEFVISQQEFRRTTTSSAPISDFKQFIDSTVNNSIDRFNLFGLSRENNWQKRLKLLIDSKILKIENYNLAEYMPLVQTEIFGKIKNSIDDFRPASAKKRSNFNDALALTYFLKLKENNKIPILIDSNGFYSQIIQSANLSDEFTYNLNSKRSSISLIRDNTYLILKSIFDCPKIKIETIKNKFPDYYKILEEATTEITPIDAILNENKIANFFLQDSNLKQLYETNKDDFSEYLENEFFNKIWLSCYEQESFTSFIKNHYNYQNADNINHESAIREYKKGFLETYETVKKESEIFSILAQIWSDLSKTDAYKLIEIGSDDNAFQALMLFGAFRFSLPFDDELSMAEIENELSDILFDKGFLGNTIQKNYAINATIKALFDGISNGNLHKLSIGITILWSLERFKSINKLFAKYYSNQEYPHYAFAIIHSSALLKEDTAEYNRKKVLKNLNCIHDKIEVNNYKYLIGRAYLFYLLWDANFKSNFSVSLCTPINNDQYYFESLTAVSEAIDYLNKMDYQNNQTQVMLLVYGLNLKIYLMVEGANDFDLIKIERDINLFCEFETSDKGLWQGRYHDTIARYNLRLALIYYQKNNKKVFEFYLNQAEDRINKALNNTFQEKQKASNLEMKILLIRDKYESNTLTDFLNQCPV